MNNKNSWKKIKGYKESKAAKDGNPEVTKDLIKNEYNKKNWPYIAFFFGFLFFALLFAIFDIKEENIVLEFPEFLSFRGGVVGLTLIGAGYTVYRYSKNITLQ